jgi:hypothetical protein
MLAYIKDRGGGQALGHYMPGNFDHIPAGSDADH